MTSNDSCAVWPSAFKSPRDVDGWWWMWSVRNHIGIIRNLCSCFLNSICQHVSHGVYWNIGFVRFLRQIHDRMMCARSSATELSKRIWRPSWGMLGMPGTSDRSSWCVWRIWPIFIHILPTHLARPEQLESASHGLRSFLKNNTRDGSRCSHKYSCSMIAHPVALSLLIYWVHDLLTTIYILLIDGPISNFIEFPSAFLYVYFYWQYYPDYPILSPWYPCE